MAAMEYLRGLCFLDGPRKVQAIMTLMRDVHREKDMQVLDIAFTTGDLPWVTCPIQRAMTLKPR